ncbi:pisatin demethylase [Colletotrichum incanum]|nr:pisatin demethylase [Colletotrichum incanum]
MSSFFVASSYTSLLGAGAGIWVLCYLLSALYSWNRLGAVPAASWTAHFSYLWLAKTTYSGRQYWVHRSLHKSKGSLIRVGPNEVVTNDPKLVRKISGTDERWARDPFYITGKFNPYHDNMFSILNPREHQMAKSRRLAAYSGRETPDLEIGMDGLVKTLIHMIEARYTSPIKDSQGPPLLDLGRTSCYFTLDVITRLAFGKEFGYLDSENDHFGFLGSLHDLWPQMSTCADVPILRKFLFSSFFLKLMGPKTTDKVGFGALMGVANHYVGKRFASNEKPQQDMLVGLLHNQSGLELRTLTMRKGSMIKHGLNQVECETEGLFMIIAGTESTASAIRSALVHTMTSPLVYQKLKAEIHTAIREGKVSSPITFQEAKALPYLQAVIYESIRMRPPLIGYFPKVVPAGGENILGYYLPAGTAIGTNMSAILASTDLFGPDADVFRPERFTELEEDSCKQMKRDVELAFGSGQWMCMGKTIAFMEINKSVFEIFRAFDMQLVQPFAPSTILTYGTFLESKLMVKVSKSDIS